MSPRREWFVDYQECQSEKFVIIADRRRLQVRGTRSVLIDAWVDGQWEPRKINNVQYILDLGQNLFSTGVATSLGYVQICQGNECRLIDDKNNKTIAIGIKDESRQYCLLFCPRFSDKANISQIMSLQQWHERLGHVNPATIKNTIKNELVKGMRIDDSASFFCKACKMSKMHRASHRTNQRWDVKPGEVIHSDISGPMRTPAVGNYSYFVTFKDEASSFRYVNLITHKTEIVEKFKDFINFAEKVTERKIKVLRSDGGKEYKSMLDLLKSRGSCIKAQHAGAKRQS